VATRSHTSFQKRQKELLRAEKQRDKAAKKAQRKQEKPPDQSGGLSPFIDPDSPELDYTPEEPGAAPPTADNR
jgi:hypothetical protein